MAPYWKCSNCNKTETWIGNTHALMCPDCGHQRQLIPDEDQPAATTLSRNRLREDSPPSGRSYRNLGAPHPDDRRSSRYSSSRDVSFRDRLYSPRIYRERTRSRSRSRGPDGYSRRDNRSPAYFSQSNRDYYSNNSNHYGSSREYSRDDQRDRFYQDRSREDEDRRRRWQEEEDRRRWQEEDDRRRWEEDDRRRRDEDDRRRQEEDRRKREDERRLREKEEEEKEKEEKLRILPATENSQSGLVGIPNARGEMCFQLEDGSWFRRAANKVMIMTSDPALSFRHRNRGGSSVGSDRGGNRGSYSSGTRLGNHKVEPPPPQPADVQPMDEEDDPQAQLWCTRHHICGHIQDDQNCPQREIERRDLFPIKIQWNISSEVRMKECRRILQDVGAPPTDTAGMLSALYSLNHKTLAYDCFINNRDCLFRAIYSDILEQDIDESSKEAFMLLMTEINTVVRSFIRNTSRYTFQRADRIAADVALHHKVKALRAFVQKDFSSRDLLGKLFWIHQEYDRIPLGAELASKVEETITERGITYRKSMEGFEDRINEFLLQRNDIKRHRYSEFIAIAFRSLVKAQPSAVQPDAASGWLDLFTWPSIQEVATATGFTELTLPVPEGEEHPYMVHDENLIPSVDDVATDVPSV